ncbi:hypothetical protein SmJEL517_g04762 [Synchytrium microbalum]|uniref:Major facilitator superfamily (MFS) profile domain-containing protein n=1 Tax=Synchytrium microbalum TaxID=1806994 RepID=A0A507C273_9FUNG|nr:uncharacterized protein SmJEL517_g04762 [Synchytrium microbalum]TPX32056.1 hypothetical protein SmJEL517_g04762 [Synchytrium microbalum]
MGASLMLLLCVTVAALSTFQFGFASGVINQPRDAITVCKEIEAPNQVLPNCIPMNDIEWGLFVSLFLLGGILGGLSGGYASTSLGRRRALLYNNLWYFMGGGFLALGNNAIQLMFGRFLVGIGAGVSTVVVGLYINELAPPFLRGSLGACNQLSIVVGVGVSQLVGVGVSQLLGIWLSTPTLWRSLFACTWGKYLYVPFSLAPPEVLMTGWLSSQGLVLDAKRALQKLRGIDGVDDELTDILSVAGATSNDSLDARPFRPGHDFEDDVEGRGEDGNDADDENDTLPIISASSPSRIHRNHGLKPTVTVFNLFKIKALRGPLIAAFGCQVAQQLSGINAAIYYSTTIFKQSYDAKTATLLTMIVSLVNFVMTLVSLVLIERLGRKQLIIISQGTMGVCALGLAGAFSLNFAPSVIALMLMMFVGAFAVGLGPIPWLILPELIPSYATGPSASICTAINWTSSFVVALVLPSAISLARTIMTDKDKTLLDRFAALSKTPKDDQPIASEDELLSRFTKLTGHAPISSVPTGITTTNNSYRLDHPNELHEDIINELLHEGLDDIHLDGYEEPHISLPNGHPTTPSKYVDFIELLSTTTSPASTKRTSAAFDDIDPDVKALLDEVHTEVKLENKHGEIVRNDELSLMERVRKLKELEISSSAMTESSKADNGNSANASDKKKQPAVNSSSSNNGGTGSNKKKIVDKTAKITLGAPPTVPSLQDFSNEDDPDTWCCICNDDAVVSCHECDDDKYCLTCFRAGHYGNDPELRRHVATKYVKPKRTLN